MSVKQHIILRGRHFINKRSTQCYGNTRVFFLTRKDLHIECDQGDRVKVRRKQTSHEAITAVTTLMLCHNTSALKTSYFDSPTYFIEPLFCIAVEKMQSFNYPVYSVDIDWLEFQLKEGFLTNICQDLPRGSKSLVCLCFSVVRLLLLLCCIVLLCYSQDRVKDLMASCGVVANCNPLHSPSHFRHEENTIVFV